MKFVVYKRLSKESKNGNNLGLDAQQSTIDQYLSSLTNPEVVDIIEEIETGTNKRKRPQLLRAIQLCKEQQATLLIAKLDRLARNVHVVSGLMESKINFLALDLREANPLTIHIIAAVAEAEARMISARTKAALKVLQDQGIKLGPKVPLTAKDSEPYRRALNERKKAEATRFAEKMYPTLKFFKDKGLNNKQVAVELNEKGYTTFSGAGKWHTTTVQRYLKRTQTLT